MPLPPTSRDTFEADLHNRSLIRARRHLGQALGALSDLSRNPRTLPATKGTVDRSHTEITAIMERLTALPDLPTT